MYDILKLIRVDFVSFTYHSLEAVPDRLAPCSDTLMIACISLFWTDVNHFSPKMYKQYTRINHSSLTIHMHVVSLYPLHMSFSLPSPGSSVRSRDGNTEEMLRCTEFLRCCSSGKGSGSGSLSSTAGQT